MQDKKEINILHLKRNYVQMTWDSKVMDNIAIG